MCEKCDAEFGAMSEEEIRAEAKMIAAFAAEVICKVEPTPAGAVAVTAIGHALIATMKEGLDLAPGESMTPKMSDVAQRLGAFAADVLREAYAKPHIIVPPSGIVVSR